MDHNHQKIPDDDSSLSPIMTFILSLTVVALASRLTVQSFNEPGGILHGLKISARPYLSLPPGSYWVKHVVPIHEDICTLRDLAEDPMPAVRSRFSGRASIVYGWPSTDGVWVHEKCYGVELDFLGLPRFESSDTERFSEAEDAFCRRMQWIGANFYKSEYEYNSQIFEGRESEPEPWYGWSGAVPDEGVWVLHINHSQSAKIGVSRIRNAFSMVERCKAIELLGGRCYERWEDVFEIPMSDSSEAVISFQ